MKILPLATMMVLQSAVIIACGQTAEEQGNLGQPCYRNDTCNAPYECRDGICVEDEVIEEGGLGQPCYPNDTCDVPYECRDGICVKDEAIEEGGLGQPCYPNDTCDAPYECQDGICVKDEAIEEGGLGQPCYPNDTCDAPYECRDGICVEDEAIEEGGLGQPCYSNDTCDAPYECRDGICVEDEAIEEGGLGQPCYPNGTCDAPYECRDGICVEDEAIEEGGLGQPCYPSDTCDAPYECRDGICVEDEVIEEGDLDQPCYPDDTCDEPYVCQDGICVEDEGGGGPTSISGFINSWPVTVPVPGLDARNLPLVAVWFSTDGNLWWSMNSNCNGGRAYYLRNGEIQLRNTYCTQNATRYQIFIEEPDEHYYGQISSFPTHVYSDLFTRSQLPVAWVYTTRDGSNWRADHGACGINQTFKVNTEGRLSLHSTYCTSGSIAYQVAVKAPTDHFAGQTDRYPITIPSTRFDASAFPNITPWWTFDGNSWTSFHAKCVGGNEFDVRQGFLRLNGNYCTQNSHSYQVSIGD